MAEGTVWKPNANFGAADDLVAAIFPSYDNKLALGHLLWEWTNCNFYLFATKSLFIEKNIFNPVTGTAKAAHNKYMKMQHIRWEYKRNKNRKKVANKMLPARKQMKTAF